MDFYGAPAPQPGFRNLLINGNFAINQRGYASGTPLTQSGFAHDRWRDIGGQNTAYTFTQGTPDTLITITAGQVNQVVESQNVAGGTYVLSWTGTAGMDVQFTNASGPTQINASTSPLVLTGIVAGTSITVFSGVGGGTLGLLQLEQGGRKTPFERRPIGIELALCQRYFYAYKPLNAEYFYNLDAQNNVNLLGLAVHFPVTMRAVPTITYAVGGSGTFNSNNPNVDDVSAQRVRLRADGSNFAYLTALTASAEL